MAGTFHYQPNELKENLKMIVDQILQPGKGIYSADESDDTMTQKLAAVCLSYSKDIRHQYNNMRFLLLGSMSNYVSAVVMNEDDLNGKTEDCQKFTDVIKDNCMVVGVNVTTGSEKLGMEHEEVSQGLDGLFEKCGEFRKIGICLAKWRIVLKLGPNTPSDVVVVDNANSAARFAAICQANCLVPLIEIEIPNKGGHCIFKAQRTIEEVLSSICKHLIDHNVFLDGVILSPTLSIPGSESSMFCDAAAIACSTVTAFRRSVPSAVGGLAILSSGLSLHEAVGDLSAIITNNYYKPWPITFNFGNQSPDQLLGSWQGKPDKVKDARCYLLKTLQEANQALVRNGC